MNDFPTIEYARQFHNRGPETGKYSASERELRGAADARRASDAGAWGEAQSYITNLYKEQGGRPYNWSDLDTQIRTIDHFDAIMEARAKAAIPPVVVPPAPEPPKIQETPIPTRDEAFVESVKRRAAGRSEALSAALAPHQPGGLLAPRKQMASGGLKRRSLTKLDDEEEEDILKL